MGIVGDALNDIFNKIEDLFIFIIAYTVVVFVAGSWFGILYGGTEVFWWPLYLLAFVMIVKVLMDISRAGKKAASGSEGK